MRMCSKPGDSWTCLYHRFALVCGHPERVRFALRMDLRAYGFLKQTIAPHMGEKLSLQSVEVFLSMRRRRAKTSQLVATTIGFWNNYYKHNCC